MGTIEPPPPTNTPVTKPDEDGNLLTIDMANRGEIICEGKTKIIYEYSGKTKDTKHTVMVENKDRITAFNEKKSDKLEGKAELSNNLNAMVFEVLGKAGIKTSFLRKFEERYYVAKKCDMIPIEWVARRIATGSYLKRHPGVKEGFRFTPLKIETFLKDDENDDPMLSMEQILEMHMKVGGVKLGRHEYDCMRRHTILVFEILERAWTTFDCTLVDLKIEFGVDTGTGEIILSDVIDNDSWRLWPYGDKSQMKDKQVYRDGGSLKKVKANFQWVVDEFSKLDLTQAGLVVIVMGSPSDLAFGGKIKEQCEKFNLKVHLRVCSAHKSTMDVLELIAEYEDTTEPVVYIAVAGRSNGLGPVISGNSTHPVINCPPLKEADRATDIWSSLSTPTGLGCCTVLTPDAAASCSSSILALSDFMTWARYKNNKYLLWKGLSVCDTDLKKSIQ